MKRMNVWLLPLGMRHAGKHDFPGKKYRNVTGVS
jgi:hypothetical protein